MVDQTLFISTTSLAEGKARAAILFGQSSASLAANNRTLAGGPAYRVEYSNGGLASLGGGLLIYDNNSNVIGAIGISGYPSGALEYV